MAHILHVTHINHFKHIRDYFWHILQCLCNISSNYDILLREKWQEKRFSVHSQNKPQSILSTIPTSLTLCCWQAILWIIGWEVENSGVGHSPQLLFYVEPEPTKHILFAIMPQHVILVCNLSPLVNTSWYFD